MLHVDVECKCIIICSICSGVSPGAASSVVGMVTLLAAATALSQMISVKDAALHGEGYQVY